MDHNHQSDQHLPHFDISIHKNYKISVKIAIIIYTRNHINALYVYTSLSLTKIITVRTFLLPSGSV